MALITLKDGGTFWTLADTLFGRAAVREPGEQNAGGGGGTGAGQAVTADSALKLSAVWACTKLIAESVGAMPVRVWTINDDGSKTLNKDHWLNRLFREAPNRYQTPNEFFETIMISYGISGNVYCRKTYRSGNRGEVISLMPLMPAQINVNLNSNGARSYELSEGSKQINLTQESVWHVPMMPSNGVVGLSPLEYGARSMGIAIASENRVANMASTGFRPEGLLQTDQTFTKTQRDQLKKSHGDAGRRSVQVNSVDDNAGLTVLEAGYKFQQISLSPKDVQLLEGRHFSIEDIARFYGVPSVLINDTSATTVWGSGISEIKEGFYTLTLQPLLEKLQASVVKWLIPRDEWGKIAVEFDFSAFLRGNQAQRTETLTSGIAGNLLTINEARAIEGLSPVPNGDVMYAQSQMIPIGSNDVEPDPTNDTSV